MPREARLLFDSLDALAETRADESLFIYIDERGNETQTLSCSETRDQAARLAGAIRREGDLSAGDRVLLAYPPGLDMVLALLACMHAGVVPAPVALPTGGIESLRAICADCRPSAILTSHGYATSRGGTMAREAMKELGIEIPWLATDRLEVGEALPRFCGSPDEVAVIQYTSGSTRSPRGVCISLANLAHQLAFEREALRGSPESRYVFWLPHYHDFGLISAIFGAAHGGCLLVLTSPMTFLRSPRLWGDLLHRYKATHTAAPDSSYRMLIERTTAEERAAWDLGALEYVACAAEPIREKTVELFEAAMEPASLPENAFCPCYGLAEHSVGICIGGRVRARVSREALEREGRIVKVDSEDDAIVLFGNGVPPDDIHVRIVDPETRRERERGMVGEIWVDSPSKGLGYYGREEESRETFRAQLVGDRRAFLRTGDLGTLIDGEVVVTGRLKDMVILGGRNVYPQDVEEVTCEAHEALRPGYVVCFGSTSNDDAEEMVIVAELRKGGGKLDNDALSAICRSIRVNLRNRLGLSSFVLALAKPASVLRTSSGKLRRASCRQAWEGGAIECYSVDRGLGL